MLGAKLAYERRYTRRMADFFELPAQEQAREACCDVLRTARIAYERHAHPPRSDPARRIGYLNQNRRLGWSSRCQTNHVVLGEPRIGEQPKDDVGVGIREQLVEHGAIRATSERLSLAEREGATFAVVGNVLGWRRGTRRGAAEDSLEGQKIAGPRIRPQPFAILGGQPRERIDEGEQSGFGVVVSGLCSLTDLLEPVQHPGGACSTSEPRHDVGTAELEIRDA